MLKPTTFFLLALAAVVTSCSTTETDGRHYSNTNASPVQGKMGVTYQRVKVPGSAAPSTESAPRSVESDGLLGVFTGENNEPPGLLDRNAKPDEPGAVYYMHGQQSASPIQGKMGVRVSRKKK